MKRRKVELGGIWPKAIKHTAFSSFTFFTLEKMNRTEKVEGVGESESEREREKEREREQSPTSTILKSIVCSTSAG